MGRQLERTSSCLFLLCRVSHSLPSLEFRSPSAFCSPLNYPAELHRVGGRYNEVVFLCLFLRMCLISPLRSGHISDSMSFDGSN